MDVEEQLQVAITNYKTALASIPFVCDENKIGKVESDALEKTCKLFLYEGFKVNVLEILGNVAAVKEME